MAQQSASLLFFAACIFVPVAPALWQAPLDTEGVLELATFKQQVKAPCINMKDATRPAVASFLIFLCLSFSATASPDFTILLFSFKLNPVRNFLSPVISNGVNPYNEFFSKKFPSLPLQAGS